ncbi:hypothetical protein CHCC14814_1009 [Bacillus paralicheniformis]|nr:hypothetical protein CHCC14814_1009 [Bacillus paralicheniformis]
MCRNETESELEGSLFYAFTKKGRPFGRPLLFNHGLNAYV